MSRTSDSSSTSSTWSLTRIGLFGSAVLLLAAIASAFLKDRSVVDNAPVAETGAPSAPAAARPASPANPVELPATVKDASIMLLEGGAKKLSDYQGKVLIVDLWATWCGPCRQEIPYLIQLGNEYKAQGVEVIGLTNEDPVADAPKVRDFSQQFKINYPIGWADQEVAFGIMRLAGRGGIPQTLIIGRDGKVRNHFVGFHPVISVPQMKAALEEAIKAG
jgi:cytochrome c biogenesis protein CcmG, thiol:disulfide interchange protein DsbE